MDTRTCHTYALIHAYGQMLYIYISTGTRTLHVHIYVYVRSHFGTNVASYEGQDRYVPGLYAGLRLEI